MEYTPHYYEHDGYVTIAGRDADICIPDCGWQAILEHGMLTIYGAESDGRWAADDDFWLNGRKLEADGEKIQVSLLPGDRLMLGGSLFVYFENYLEAYGEEGRMKVFLAERGLGRVPFEGFPYFTRSPRLIMRVPDQKVEIGKPPAAAAMPKGSLIQMILPPLLMLCVTVAVSVFMKRGIYVLMSIVSTMMTLIFTVMRYFNEKKDCWEKTDIRSNMYQDYLLKKRKELKELHDKEEDALHYNFPELKDIESMIRSYSSRIYERDAEDDDFLAVSVGKRREKVSFPISYPYDELEMEKDELEEKAKAVSEKFAYIEDKPVVIDLKKAHLGLVGESERVREQMKLIVAQLAFQQSYHDLQIILIHGKSCEDDFKWMDWYPHLKIQALNILGNINSERMRDQVLGSLLQILKDRNNKIEESSKQSKFLPHFLFIIDEPKLVIDHSIMEYLSKSGRELGFSLIYSGRLQGNLPEYIGTIIDLKDSEEAELILDEGEVVNRKFRLNHVGDCDLEWMARNLSVLIHNQGITSNIPESITFFDMYKVKRPQEFGSEGRWMKNQSYKSLAVPLRSISVSVLIY